MASDKKWVRLLLALWVFSLSGDYDPATDKEVSAAGRAQGIALPFGKGRVVILGEAAMLTAQIQGNVHFGMQRAGNDNRQFALNTLHWLSRLLE